MPPNGDPATDLNGNVPAGRQPPGHPGGINRVQVGCGPYHLRPDWWNTDLRSFGGIDETLDATKPWPWNGLLDYVYGEHFLEHLEIDQAIAFLVEAGRALRHGGRIRLSTPSLEWVVKTHFSFAPPESDRQFDDAMEVNRAFYGWGHRFLHTRTTIARFLRSVGYEDVWFFPYGESATPDLCRLEMHESGPDADGYPSQWIVEGMRGETPIASPPGLNAEIEAKLLAHVRGGY